MYELIIHMWYYVRCLVVNKTKSSRRKGVSNSNFMRAKYDIHVLYVRMFVCSWIDRSSTRFLSSTISFQLYLPPTCHLPAFNYLCDQYLHVRARTSLSLLTLYKYEKKTPSIFYPDEWEFRNEYSIKYNFKWIFSKSTYYNECRKLYSFSTLHNHSLIWLNFDV